MMNVMDDSQDDGRGISTRSMDMLYEIPWKAIFVLGPIFGLLFLGLLITLRSGEASVRTHQGAERLASNLSHLLLRMAGYGIGILAVQRLVGAPFSLSW